MVRALLAVALAALPVDEAPGSPPDVPVLIVRGGGWAGSGVVWDAAAHRVLTALHVVEEMPPDAIEVVARGVRLAARIVDREPLLDLALLEVAGPLEAGPPLGMAAALLPGDVIALAGCPRARCSRGDGQVIAPARPFAGSRYLAVLGEARPGASGGVVLDGRGAVVGIIDLALLREPGVALAVPIEFAMRRFPRS